MLNPGAFVRLVVDPIRLAVLGTSASGPVDLAGLAEDLGVPKERVVKAAGRLREAGLLDDDLTLRVAVLRDLAARLPQDEPARPELFGEIWTAGEAEVLARFFSGARLTQIPTQSAKRRIVLERLAQEFEPGVRYPEKQVNFTLQLFHADYAALRRYLVDEGFLTRAEGVYWRTGGRN